MNERPIVACFETEVWEEAYLRERLPQVELRATAQTLGPDTAELARDAQVISVFIHSHITSEVLAQLPAARAIATRSTGYDHIDLGASHERSIVVSSVPTYG